VSTTPAEAPNAARAGMMTVEEVARRISMSDSFVYGAIHDGRLKHHRFGKGQGGIRVSEAQLAAFLAETERAGSPAPELPKKRYRNLT
jgi:excisionase family DNA binding protein